MRLIIKSDYNLQTNKILFPGQYTLHYQCLFFSTEALQVVLASAIGMRLSTSNYTGAEIHGHMSLKGL